MSPIQAISDLLKQHGVAVDNGAARAEEASKWLAAGFDDAEEVDEWLRAKCFTAEHAQKLEAAGITPAQSALLTKAGAKDYQETIAYKTFKGDLSLDEARRVIESEFWKT